MNDLADTRQQTGLSVLDGLALQAQMFVQNAAMNLRQLGRVLSEARPLVPHGQFDEWCKKNAKMSRRAAEQCMQAYAEFGLNTKIAELGTTKIIKLLPMSEEERETLLAENDVAAMSTRQLDEAIRKQRGQLLKEARAEAKTEIERHAQAAKNLLDEKLRLQRELGERDEDLLALQEEYNKAQEQLAQYQSAEARGDADRLPADVFTPDVFSRAVNEFVGTCCRLPQMSRMFSTMSSEDREKYDQSLRALENFVKSARKAVDSYEYGEAIIVG